MGIFDANVLVGDPAGGDMVRVSAVVDTGAGYSMMPRSLLEQLHVHPLEYRRFLLADGSEMVNGFGMARFAIADPGDGLDESRELPCPVIFGPEEEYLLGATTLEIFGLMVDPLGQQLIPVVHRVRPI